jgi:hypothetical protein
MKREFEDLAFGRSEKLGSSGDPAKQDFGFD